MKVTATQGGSTYAGLLIHVIVLTGAKPVAAQTGGTGTGSIVGTTSFTAAGTVQQATSFLYGTCDRTGSTLVSTATGTNNVIVDDIEDSANTMRYVTHKSLAPATGSQTYGHTTASGNDGLVCWAEILAATTLAESATAPPMAWTTSAVTVQTADFTPPGGSLLVTLVSSDGGASTTTMTVTDDQVIHCNWAERVLRNDAGKDYCGIWIADVPSSGATPGAGRADAAGTAPAAAGQPAVTGTAPLPSATGTAPAVNVLTGLATAPLYAATATAISGSWADTSNAAGSTQGTYATWTDDAAGSSAVLELAAFGAQAAVPAGSTVNTVTCTIRHGETPAAQITSATAQAYPAGSPSGAALPLTVSADIHDDTVTFTGLTWADLADLRVRVTLART